MNDSGNVYAWYYLIIDHSKNVCNMLSVAFVLQLLERKMQTFYLCAAENIRILK